MPKDLMICIAHIKICTCYIFHISGKRRFVFFFNLFECFTERHLIKIETVRQLHKAVSQSLGRSAPHSK